ncbi:HAAS signaling domain-containing protein [Psychrobacillus sp.]|uniref:DUF1700 domain-containing protein n=1 Tax=Psychrobacillus sp. TaxID=1871623 RepID=UPI0028BECA86|nr:DUF1700 domain-containing protein [Psychrobacillus sp.]
MNKSEFLAELATKLNALPQSEMNKSLAYYSEIIDDRMEDGMSEVDAVCGLGNVEEIAQEEMIEATPLPKLIIPSRPLSKLEIVLLFICSPLIITLLALILAFYATVWLVIISLFLLDFSFALAGVAGIIASIVDFRSNIPISLLMFICSLISIGIGIVAFKPIKIVSNKILGLTTWVVKNIKLKLIRKRL